MTFHNVLREITRFTKICNNTLLIFNAFSCPLSDAILRTKYALRYKLVAMVYDIYHVIRDLMN